jgi:hypothetical protein
MQVSADPIDSVKDGDFVIVADAFVGTDFVNLAKIPIKKLFEGVEASPYVQTYTTTGRTNGAAKTDNTGGTPGATYVAISAAYSQTEIRNNFATAAAEILQLKQLVNALIDDLQAINVVG